jgi:hypothetical protein
MRTIWVGSATACGFRRRLRGGFFAGCAFDFDGSEFALHDGEEPLEFEFLGGGDFVPVGVGEGAFDGVGGDDGNGVSDLEHAAADLDGAEFRQFRLCFDPGVEKPLGGFLPEILQGGKLAEAGFGVWHSL